MSISQPEWGGKETGERKIETEKHCSGSLITTRSCAFCSILKPSKYERVHLHTCQSFCSRSFNHPPRVQICLRSLIALNQSFVTTKMNRQSPDSRQDKPSQEAPVSEPKPVQPRLLTRIYYPDTLYPDSYTFFANRTSSMADTHDQTSVNPETRRSPTRTDSASRQNTAEIETTERQNKSSVCNIQFWLCSSYFHS